MAVADDVRGDFLGQIGLAGTAGAPLMLFICGARTMLLSGKQDKDRLDANLRIS